MSYFRWLIREVHQRSLWQVLGIYLAAGWVAYQVVLSLRDGIGLQGWVPGLSVVLLVLGLPIVLATAFVQEGGPSLRATQPVEGDGASAATSPDAASASAATASTPSPTAAAVSLPAAARTSADALAVQPGTAGARKRLEALAGKG